MPHHVEVIEGEEHPVQGGLCVELLDLVFIECLSGLGISIKNVPAPPWSDTAKRPLLSKAMTIQEPYFFLSTL